MDNRLFDIVSRPGRLRRQDLPLVARALLSFFRGQAEVKTGFVRNLGYVRFVTSSFQVQILAEDWAKIEPYVRNDSFTNAIVVSQIDPTWIDTVAVHQSSIVDITDREYFLRIYYVLWTLFPEAYPTSAL